MRKLILMIFMAMSMMAVAQSDTTLTIRISKNKPFPQIGLDTKGRKYFVMSTRQDKAALIALEKGLYADSLLWRYEQMQLNYEDQIDHLEQRIDDKNKLIDSNNKACGLLENNYKDRGTKIDNLNKNIEDLKKQVGRQKLPMWIGAAAAIVGSIIIIDAIKD